MDAPGPESESRPSTPSRSDATGSDPGPPRVGGLGRGLGALIPRGQPGLQEIELARIGPNPQQPRQRVDEAGLAELAESLRQHGVLQPVVVARAEGEDARYVLIAGERRWRAARLANLKTIPAIVKDAAPRQRLELAMVENLQREDLDPLEMAAAYRALIDEHGLTQEQIAQRVGKSRVAVANTLRLLQLPRAATEALAGGRITEGHARALLGAPHEAGLLEALDAVTARGLTVRETEELVRRAASEGGRVAGRVIGGVEDAPPDPRPRRSVTPQGPPPDPQIPYLEERFRQALGTKVQLVRARRGGRLIIHFYSDEELQGIYEAICREP